MKLSIDIEADDQVTPWLAAVARDIEAGRNVNGVNGYVARSVAHGVREHLRREAVTRHATADRLGAKPPGHLERGAEAVEAKLEEDGIIIALPIPGIGRAFSDVTITPTLAKYLTIPATAEAYGRRAGSFNDLRLAFFGKDKLALVRPVPKDKDGEKQKPVVFFWLKKSVFQKQDRTLLPSDEELLQAAEDGAEEFLDDQLERTA